MDYLLDNPQALGLIVGVVLPLLISVVQQPKLPRWARIVVAVATSIIAGTVTVITAGNFHTADWFSTVAAVAVAAETSYKAIWKPTGVSGYIETATSPTAYLEDGDVEDDYDPADYEDLEQDLGQDAA